MSFLLLTSFVVESVIRAHCPQHSEKLEEVIKEISIISESDILRMKMKALSVFKKEFSADSYFKEMDEVTSIL